MKICVVTGTRAEYGILSGLMADLRDAKEVTLQIVATNMHLSERYGMTVREIEADGFNVDRRVPLPLDDNSAAGTVRAMGVAMEGFADAFRDLAPDIILLLGDRYEMLAAASAALIFGIPVAHFHGGEVTEGAYDDSIRNAITKLSTYHFTATEEYRQRVISMGEDPAKVFNVGSLGVDNILRDTPMDLDEFNRSLRELTGADTPEMPDGFLLVTFHPVTRQPGEEERQTRALLKALDHFPERKILFTMPNSDTGGDKVARMIREWTEGRGNEARRDGNDAGVVCVTSLGKKRYYSALAHCGAVVGNSSSGLIEAPSFGVPTVNIGDRQRGRARGNTVIDCEASEDGIVEAIAKALTPEFSDLCRDHGENPYRGVDTRRVVLRHLLQL